MLTTFERAVHAGKPIDRRLQVAVNAVMAKALLIGKLPPKPAGASIRKVEVDRQRRTAVSLATHLKQGVGKTEAVRRVANAHSRDERRVYAHWEQHRGWAEQYLAHAKRLDSAMHIARAIMDGIGVTRSPADLERFKKLLTRRAELDEDLPVLKSARFLTDDT